MKNFLKKLTFRKGFIIGVTSLIICNMLFVIFYYHFYLTGTNEKTYRETINSINKELDNLNTNLSEKEFIAYLDLISTTNRSSIVLKDANNNIIYENEVKNYLKKDSISNTKLITIDNKEYLITISKTKNNNLFRLSLDFVIYECIILLVLGALGIFGANQKLLSPLTSLSKDINDYKLGIKPKKITAKNKVQEIRNEFVELVDQLEEEKQNQNRIIASISHDIKTPLTSILGYSERLSKSDLSAETKAKYANTIYNKSLVMKEIIEEFDDYLTMNINDDKKSTILIKSLIDYLNNYYKEDLKEKNIDFKIKSNCYNSYIYVDLSKFKRVFSNIISNSIRYLDKNKKVIKIDITEEKSKIKFTISDNGTGSKELKKIFEPLYTTDESRSISGLGLSICKEIIESLNGTIKAENNKMGGLSIIFKIDSYKE